MKIIKAGKLPEKETLKTTCRNCGTRFEFERGEAELSIDQRDGDTLKIACPLCREVIWIGV